MTLPSSLRTHVATALVVGLVLVSAAHAQVIVADAPSAVDPNKPPDEVAPPAPTGPQVVYSGAPQVGVVPGPMPEPYARTRFRFGMSAFGGPTRVTGQDYQGGGFGGVSFRLGAQINRTWGVYYQGQLSLGGYAYADPSTGDAAGVVFASWFNTVLASAILIDRIELAFGPSFDSIASLTFHVDAGSGSTDAYSLEGSAPGAHFRVAGILGSLNPVRDRRAGFSLSFEVHPTFIDRHLIFTLALGLGMDWY